MGFKDIVGIDCSKSLLEQANNTKSYIGTDRVYFGEQNVPIPESYKGKQDFVVCHSMINNILDSSNIIFHQMIDCLRVGGYAVFATKIDLNGNNLYEQEIKELEKTGYWKFTTDYNFFRYDKLCGESMGQFSKKKVLYLVYQKIDHA